MKKKSKKGRFLKVIEKGETNYSLINWDVLSTIRGKQNGSVLYFIDGSGPENSHSILVKQTIKDILEQSE